jgi:MFS family permease
MGLWITAVPGFALGVLVLSGTYRLHELGATSQIIAIAFTGIAIINVFVNPRIGRASDRLGRRTPISLALLVAAIALGLLAAAAFEVPTVILIAIAGAVMLAVAGPGLALVGDEIHANGGDPSHATFLMNMTWGPAAALGALLAGLAHGHTGAELSLIGLGVVALGTLVLVRRYV